MLSFPPPPFARVNSAGIRILRNNQSVKTVKIDYDLHIHTEYCGHAEGMTVETICRHAEAAGLRLIAITDHAYGESEPAPVERIREEVRAARPRCRVIVGAEVDVDGRFADGRLVEQDLDRYDYVVAGLHYVPRLGHYPRSPQDRGMSEEEFLGLWEITLLGVVSNPAIDTLAHPARLFAACADLDASMDFGLAVFREAARLSVQNRIAWELNELDGVRMRLEPFLRMYEEALEAGVKLVYGSDAHAPESVGRSELVQRCLKRLPKDALSRPEDILPDL